MSNKNDPMELTKIEYLRLINFLRWIVDFPRITQKQSEEFETILKKLEWKFDHNTWMEHYESH